MRRDRAITGVGGRFQAEQAPTIGGDTFDQIRAVLDHRPEHGQTMTVRPLKVGVIGANWGLNHIEAWRAVPGVEVTCLCTSRRETAEAAARAAGVPNAVWDARALIADPDLDIIDVTPRPTIRAPLALETLEAGKHLMQPLPFALDLAQGRALRDAARSRQRIAMVENLHRHAPAFRQAKAVIDTGALGPLFTINGQVRTGILLKPAANYVYDWITDANSGASALRNFGAHLLHVLTWLFGSVASVSADISTKLGSIRFADGMEKINHTADSAALQVRFANGASGLLETSWCTTAGEGFLIDAAGDGGRLVIRADGLGPQGAQLWWAARGDPKLQLLPIAEALNGAPGLELRHDPEQPRRYPLAAMCAGMADAIRTGDTTHAHPDFDQAYSVMRTVEAAYAAARTGGWVDVASVE